MDEMRSDFPLVLIVDDVPPMVRLMALELGFLGMRTDVVLLDEDPVGRAESLQPAAIILGSSLPTPEQFDVLQQMRQRVASPVIFINGSGTQADTALAIEMGAAEVLDKPFAPDDLGLRLRAVLGDPGTEGTKMRRGTLTIDILHRIVWNGDQKISLGTSEWSILLALTRFSTAAAARDLLITIWGDSYANETRFLDLWIDRLRMNLGDDPQAPHLVLGNLQDGYRLVD